jgi:MtrB/PioB family decaheme-associated outer membrane protein
MKTFFRQFNFRPTALAVAVLAAFGPAQAQTAASEVEASVSVGVAGLSGDSGDRALFGQYNGLRERDAYGLLDVDYRRFNPTTGTSAGMLGNHLGLDTRELIFWWKKQGDWKVSADYGELVRREPYSINTGLVGAGSTSPQVTYLAGGPGSGSTLDLKTKRKSFGIGFSKWLGPSLEFAADLKSENKDGARLFGIGMNCPSAVAVTCGPTTGVNAGYALLLLPEPINSNHSQVEARLNYSGGRLGLTGGYYGSFYNNSNGTLNPSVPGSLNGPLGNLLPLSNGLQGILNQPVALPPDNQAHHFDLAGNYAFTPTVRGNFKLAYSRARQDQDFIGAGLAGAPAGIANLSGEVNTTLAQVGLSARPLPKLSLVAEVRYEDKDDKTPLALYNVEGAASYTNRNYSRQRTRGKLEGSYQFSTHYRGTVGVDYEFIDRQGFTPSSAVAGVSALRTETEETSVSVELRRRMTETFSGAVSFITSDRNGSNWLRPNSGLGVTEITDAATGFASTAIFSPTLADRRRDKVKVNAMWQASEALSLQFSAEKGKDKFSAPSAYAVRRTDMEFYNADVNYVISDAWSVNGYGSYGKQSLDQARPAGYVLGYDNKSTAFGLGVTGKAGEKFDVGGGVSYINDKSVYAQTLDAFAGAGSAALLAATGGLPDILYRRTEFRLFGKYALSKASSLRLDAIHQRTKYNDWAYDDNGVPFTFSDNTTLNWQQLQNVTYVGLTYIYAWQ